jgi:hypothetical protein
MTLPIKGADGEVYLKGLSSTVNVGTGNFNIARNLSMTGCGVGGEDPDAVLAEFKGKYTLDLKATTAANLAGSDLDDTVATLKAGLVAKGYMEAK